MTRNLGTVRKGGSRTKPKLEKMGKRKKMRGNLEIKVGVQGKLSHTKETINSMYNRKEQIFRKKIRKLY